MLPTLASETADELFMEAGAGDLQSLRLLTQSLEAITAAEAAAWPATARETWNTGIELFLEAADRDALRESDIAFLLQLARTGFDTPLLRDLLAAAARTAFGSYPDPAALLNALGVHDRTTTTPLVARHWEQFMQLAPGRTCLHSAYGVGAVAEIDGIANEVRIQFERPRRFPLPIAVRTLTLIREDSLIAALRAGRASWPLTADKPDLMLQLRTGLVGGEIDTETALRCLLVPDVLTVETLERALCSDTEPASAGPDSGAPGRPWHEARTLAELVELIEHQPVTDAPPDAAAGLRAVFHSEAGRQDRALLTAKAAAQLWQAAGDQEWLTPFLRELAPICHCWQQSAAFAELSDRLPGKLLPPWCEATLAARGGDWLATACLELPLRLWGYLERAMEQLEDGIALLNAAVQQKLRERNVSADLLLWVWRTGNIDRRALADAPLLFRTLAKDVHGSFLKADRDLRKTMMENDEFQRLLLRDGAPEAVHELVRCIRHLPLLDTGEQQSLLVRIVRLFPEARGVVEIQRRKPARRAIAKLTSVRSYEQRRRELMEIVNTRIPANSRALAHARSYGDLRENAEYKAAKEEQSYLAARRAELDDALHEIRATDFSDVQVRNRVVPGCTVTLQAENDSSEQFHVLGLWDSVPEKRMVSYDTPVGQVLLGATKDETVTLPEDRTMRITAVNALSAELAAWLGKAPD